MKNHNTLTLVAFTDESTGIAGLGIKGMPRDHDTNAATDGLLIAHDIVEHMNGPQEIGTIADELEALGAIWYVRGQHGELFRGRPQYHSIETSIAADVTRMFADFFHGAYVPLKAPRTMPCEADDTFREIIRIAVEDAPDEASTDDADADRLSDKLAEYTAICLPLMRTGYRKAVRKYEKHGRYFANNLFWAIADAVDPHAKQCEDGAEFALMYGIDDAGGAFAYCDDNYSEEE